jgi:hypothetical protein
MQVPHWLLAVGLAATGWICVAIVYWTAKNGLPKAPTTDDVFVVTPRRGAEVGVHLLVVIVPLFFFFVVVNEPPQHPDWSVALTLLWSVMTLFFCWLEWKTARFAVRVSPDGLECWTPWRARRHFRWNEVREVCQDPKTRFFVIYDVSGDVIRVASDMNEFPRLLRRLENELPPECLRGAEKGYRALQRPLPQPKPAGEHIRVGTPSINRSVSTELSDTDMLEAYAYLQGPKQFFSLVIGYGVIAFVVLLILRPIVGEAGIGPSILTTISLGLVFAAILLYSQMNGKKTWLTRFRKWPHRRQSYLITEAGIFIEAPMGQSTLPWDTIEQVIRLEHLWLAQSLGSCYIIPTRCLDEELVRFMLDKIRENNIPLVQPR